MSQRRKPTARAENHEDTSKNGGGREPSSVQKLDRYINFVPSIAFDATLQASWEASAASFQAGLLNGGPTALVWGTLLTWIGTMAMAASLGEMASINPTVGAQYRWAALYAPRRFISPAFWSLIQGWMTVFAFMATCAQVAFLEGGIVQGLIVFNKPGYTPELWHGTLLAWAILALPLFCNIFARRILPPLEIIGGLGHIVFFIVFITTLCVTARRSTAEFVFTETITGLSGWKNSGVQWCIGLLSGAFPLGSFDGVIHMSAEVKNAPRRIPQSMISSVLINGAFLFGFMICIMFTVGDVDRALASPTGYPIIEVLFMATKSHAATTVMMCFIVFMGIVAIFSTLASVSRLVWAFARDRGLPFSDFFAYVHPTLRIPLNALGLVVAVVMLITLISAGSTAAFNAILSLNTLSLYISYLIPMIFFTLAKLRGDYIPYGPFRMGPWGLVVNFFAIAYAIFIAAFLPFPATVPVTASSMNYGGPVVGAVILFAVGDWMVTGRKRFKGPVEREEIESEDKAEGHA